MVASICTISYTAQAGSRITGVISKTGTVDLARKTSGVDAYVPPHLNANVSANPDSIWPENGKGNPKATTVTITVNGAGNPAIAFKPQDIVFIIDCSQSMRYISDPNDLRLGAVQHYMDQMIPPDRCVAVRLSSDAVIINNHTLTENYTLIKQDIDSLYGTAAGQTNYEAAFDIATNELVSYGKSDHQWVEIFLTDGQPEPITTNVTSATMNEITSNNITVYTIGLGSAQDKNLLKWIANQTQGKYYDAPNASALYQIYTDIANQFIDFTASYGGTLYFILPSINHYQNNSVSNGTGNIDQSSVTTFTWTLPKMTIYDVWQASFNMSSVGSGWVSIDLVPDSRVDYHIFNGSMTNVNFPDTKLWVIPDTPGPPPMPILPTAPIAPIPVPPAALMAPVTQAAVTMQPVFSLTTVAQASGISTAELIAPFIGLGIGTFAKNKGRIKTKRTIDIGVRERAKTQEEIEAIEKEKKKKEMKAKKSRLRTRKRKINVVPSIQ